ncbi:hypothetical protein Pcinc_019011, partial [Petrolisthes cinctipes]
MNQLGREIREAGVYVIREGGREGGIIDVRKARYKVADRKARYKEADRQAGKEAGKQ